MPLHYNPHMRIALGSDHHGVTLKARIKEALEGAGRRGAAAHTCVDFGAHAGASADYPDFARPVAEGVASGAFDRGILICSNGIGMSNRGEQGPGRARRAGASSRRRAAVPRAQRRQRRDAGRPRTAAGARPGHRQHVSPHAVRRRTPRAARRQNQRSGAARGREYLTHAPRAPASALTAAANAGSRLTNGGALRRVNR